MPSCKRGGREVAIFNVGGTIYAIGGDMHTSGWIFGEGDLDGAVVTCPLHGAQFDVTTGQVVGPPAGESVPVFTVAVDGEEIQVDVS